MPATPTIILYGPREAPWVEKVARGLALKKLDFQRVEPAGPEDYRRWNPETGRLPVLELDGERVHESTRILRRVDERFPEPPLFAADPMLAAKQEQLGAWCEETFNWIWTRYQQLAARAAEAQREVDTRRTSWLRLFLRWIGALGMARPQRAPMLDQIRNRLEDLVRFLADRPFFYADRISMADLSVYAMLRVLDAGYIPGARAVLAEHANLGAFMLRVERETGG